MNILKANISLLARNALRNNWRCNRHMHELISHEYSSVGELAALQSGMLRRTINSAVKKIPAYSYLKVRKKSGLKLSVKTYNAYNAQDLLLYFQENFPVISTHELISARRDYYPNYGKAWPWTRYASGPAPTPASRTCVSPPRWCRAARSRRPSPGGSCPGPTR